MQDDRKLQQIEGSGIVGGLLGGGGGCFVAGTLVAVPGGFKEIQDIQPGDAVYSFKPTGEIVVGWVSSTNKHEKFKVNRYKLWQTEFVATPNHHVLTENYGYKQLQNFTITECLVDAIGELQPLMAVESITETATVYNFIVEGWHNYLITEKGIRVSNGGGGKKGHTAKTEDDAYKSNATAYIIELLSAGPVEGLIGGAQGIYLDKTPVQNADSSYNFKNFQYDFRNGTQFQTYMPGYGDEISSEKDVSAEVKQLLPVSRTIISSQIDGIRVRVGAQQQEYKDNGDVVGMTLNYKIYVKQGGGAFELRVNETRSGRLSTLTEFEYYLPVNNLGGTVDTFTVKIEKVNADIPESDTKKQQVLKWQSYTEVIETKLNYAHSAIIGEQFNPKEFGSIPSRQYKIGGILFQIPTNATVHPTNRGLDFTGTWDGTFKPAPIACSDPAWVAYYLLTDEVNGLGRYIDTSTIDKWSLYRCSQYNNQYVPDGLGGTERRFSCNTVIQQREDAWKLLEAVFTAFNCSHYWADGTVYFVQDRPLDPGEEYKWQFSQADVEGGTFSYSRSALRSRSSVAYVTWNDPSDFYNQTTEPVEDPEALAKYGYKEIDFAAFGCTSRGQAIRKGRYVLFSNNQEVETVTFSCRSWAAYVRPGEVIQIADARRAAIRYGGLVSSATAASVTLDAPIAILSSGYRITCMMPDGTLQTRNVANSLGSTQTVNISGSFTQIPLPESNWVISAPSVLPQLFRVMSNSSDPADPTKHTIAATQYIPAKYDFIEKGWSIPDTPTRQTIPTVVSKPRSPALASTAISGSLTLVVSWQQPLSSDGSIDPFIDSYEVEYSRDNATWQQTQTTSGTSVLYENVAPGVYFARVRSVDISGNSSDYVQAGPFTAQVVQKPPVLISTETQDFRNPGNSSSIFF